VALGSGGTMAGLVAALGPDKVLGIDTGAMPDPLPAVARFAAEAGEEPVDSGALRARFDQVGSGYGDLVESVAAAMSLIATTEGIVLDPIYTGRALAGLIAAVNDGDITSGSTTVFMHTGGLPGLFGHPVTVSYAQSLLQTFG
jgi:L-cysteate sulfo-lyase